MARWPAAALSALTLAICASCGTSADEDVPSSTPAHSEHVGRSEPVYSPAPPRLRTAALRFVRSIAEYDARAEERQAFLGKASAVITSSEEDRLRRAPRNHLSWRILRRRDEQTRLTITGVTTTPNAAGHQPVCVEAILTTTTDLARMRTFAQFQLTAVPTPTGWLIDHAVGPGL